MKKINLLASFCIGVFGIFAANIGVVEGSNPEIRIVSPATLVAEIAVFSDKLGEIQKLTNMPDVGLPLFNEAKQGRLKALEAGKQKIINDVTTDLFPYMNSNDFMGKILFAWSFFARLPYQPESEKRQCVEGAVKYLSGEYYDLYRSIFIFFGRALPGKSQKLLDLIHNRKVDEDDTATFIRYMLSCLNPNYDHKLTYSNLSPTLFDAIGGFVAEENQNSPNEHVRAFQEEVSACLVPRDNAEKTAAVYSLILGSLLIERLHSNDPSAVSEAQNKVRAFMGQPVVPAQQIEQATANANSGRAIESVFGFSTLFRNPTQNQNNTDFYMSFLGGKK